MKRSRLVWFGSVILIGIFLWWRFSNTQHPIAYHVVDIGDVEETVSVSGTLAPVQSADLSFEITGTVSWVGVEVGDRVKEGQQLVKLDRARLSVDYAIAQQELSKAIEEERKQRRHWKALKPEVRAQTKANVTIARARVQSAAIAMKKATLFAPISGIVTLQEAREGEYVSGIVVRIVADDAFEIEALVPESDIMDFVVGKEGEAAVDALGPEEVVAVAVARIEPEATVLQDVVYYKVFFDSQRLTSAGGMVEGLRSGMSADIDLVMAHKSDVVRIPRRLVHQDEEGFFVTMDALNDDGSDVLQKRRVRLGIQGDDGMVEVVEGLNEGDKIREMQEE